MRLNLNVITEPTVSSPEEIKKVAQGEDKYLGAKIHRMNTDTHLRILFSKFFAVVIAFWLLAVILILIGNHYNYRLSDTVLVTLLTTTTVQVLGMMTIILWDLFPGNSNHNIKPLS